MQLKKSLATLSRKLTKVAITPFLWLIYFYRHAISPFLPNACRFTPTCSRYAIDALKTHGLFRGLALTVWRLLRCNPWGGSGYDPVPPRREK